jgi:hypothetical protein
MHYRCTKCELTECRGLLPGATCGLLMFAQIGIAAATILAVIPRIFGPGLGWWWLAAAPAAVALSLPAAYLLDLVLEGIEWLLFCLRRCPSCGARSWSWGFTQGFGL